MVGSHPPIPKIKVQAVVAAHSLVVLDVMGGSVKDGAEPRIQPPGGIKFEARMTHYVPKQLPNHEHQERHGMDGDQHYREWKDTRLNDGLKRRKGISGPRRRVLGLMVNRMKPAK